MSIKWERIKERAAAEFTEAIRTLDPRFGGPAIGTSNASDAAAGILEALSRVTPDIAVEARSHAGQGWSVGEAVLVDFCERALAEGLRRIDRWDVRAADRLIELFPAAAPTYVGKAVVAREVDLPSGEDSEWVLERAPASRPSMGM